MSAAPCTLGTAGALARARSSGTLLFMLQLLLQTSSPQTCWHLVWVQADNGPLVLLVGCSEL